MSYDNRKRIVWGVEARAMRPTRNHRPAIWGSLLGTVMASNGQDTRYFDYDWVDALEYAVSTIPPGTDLDPRVARHPRSETDIRKGQKVLYLRRS